MNFDRATWWRTAAKCWTAFLRFNRHNIRVYEHWLQLQRPWEYDDELHWVKTKNGWTLHGSTVSPASPPKPR